MARCGIYVDRLYSQSESVSKINAKASGTDAVPCVKVRWPRATIHWYQTTDVKRGGLRLDGSSSAVDAVRHMLREAFPPPELMAASSEAHALGGKRAVSYLHV